MLERQNVMKVGDLIRDYHPSRSHMGRIGIILGPSVHHGRSRSCLNQTFRVLWGDGALEENVWDYNMKMINESR